MTAPTASASSHVNGAGTGTGDYTYSSTGVQSNPPCGEFTDLDYTGSYVGEVTINGVTYAGDFTVTFRNATDKWWANPFGLYDNDTCSGDGTYRIDIENFAVSGGGDPSRGERGIECGSATGDLGRVSINNVAVAPMNDTGNVQADCTVSDGISTNQANSVAITVTSLFAGPCDGTPPSNCTTEDAVTFLP